tara:strand:- start:512 stop:1474 length:963 start_codon:yes stop_codon:yes gene_type:complete
MNKFAKIAITTLPIALIAGSASGESFVRMLAGPAGGAWYPFGAKIMEVAQKDVKGIRTSNGPGGGVGNVRNVDKGAAELGWTFGFTAYEGFAGKGKFKKKHENIRYFATLYPGILQTAVPKTSSVKSYGDLKGKNFSPGKTVFSGNVTVERLVNLYGISYNDIKSAGGTIHRVGFKDSVALMKDGHVEVFTALTNVPNASFIALDFQPGIRFLPVEPPMMKKFVTQNPGFFATTIPGGAYKGVPNDTPTLATATVLIASKTLDNETAYKLAASLWNNHAEFVKVNKTWNNVKLEDALLGAAIPVHDGAMKFYAEKGVKKK